MNFRRSLRDDEPEINLIPLIDVLLVILIFLAATTSFTRYAQLRIALPQAQADAAPPQAMTLAISQDGQYALDQQWLPGNRIDDIAQALRDAAQAHGSDAMLVIHADASSTHDAVVRAMQAARDAGIARIGFATQDGP